MCIELMQNISEVDAQTANSFFQMFYLTILQDVFYVLTDSDHKSGKILTTTRSSRCWALCTDLWKS